MVKGKIVHIIFLLLFITSVSAQEVLLSEGFEGGAIPVLWTQETSDPVTLWDVQDGGFSYSSGSFLYSKTPANAYSGAYNAIFHGTEATQTILTTPAMDMTGGKVYKLSFWHTQGCYYNQALNIYYKEGAAGAWTLISSYNEILYSWTKDSVIIPSVSPEVYIGFEGIWDGGCGICLDEVSVLGLVPYDVTFNVEDINGDPIQGAIVLFNNLTKLTDVSGQAVFSDIAEGNSQVVNVRKQGYRPYYGTVDVNSDISETIVLPYSTIVYVNDDATGNNDGKNWTDAYTSLQTGLENAYEGDQVWIAQGVYKPEKQWDISSARAYSFSMKNEVALFGGFPGNPGEEGDMSVRDIAVYKTVLSGDLDNNDAVDADGISTSITGSNSFYVVYNNDPDIDNTAIFNGIYISGGFANLNPRIKGAAVMNDEASPTFINCTFTGNTSLSGVILNYICSPLYLNCTIENNIGGGMLNDEASAYVENCQFNSNSEFGMYNESSQPHIDSCVFFQNDNAIKNESAFPQISNSTFSENKIDGINNTLGAEPVIYKCVFDKTARYAINNSYSSSNVDSSVFTNNFKAFYSTDLSNTITLNITASSFIANGDNAENGGAIYSQGLGAVNISECYFESNHALNGGAIYNESVTNGTTVNSIFWKNIAVDNGGAFYNDQSQPNIFHSTIFGNKAGVAGGAIYNNTSNIQLTNTIVWGNTVNYSTSTFENISSTPVVTTCLIEGVDSDPLFMDEDYGYFSLKGNSPGVNTGTDVGATIDFDGVARPQGAAVDIGAYERNEGIEIIASFPEDNQNVVGQFTDVFFKFSENVIAGLPGLTIKLYDYNTDTELESFDVSTDVTIIDDTVYFSLSAPIDYGTYYFLISEDAFEGSVSGLTYLGINNKDYFNFTVYPSELYVKHDASGAGTGMNWTDAFTTIQEALNIAVAGQEIWVAQGTYFPTQTKGGSGTNYRTLQLKEAVTLYGGFEGLAGTEGNFSVRDAATFKTTISGDISQNDTDDDSDGFIDIASMTDNVYHIFTFDAVDANQADRITNTTLIDGFTISGGNAIGSGDHGIGAAFWLDYAAPSIKNCIFENNRAVGAVPSLLGTQTHFGSVLYAQNKVTGAAIIIDSCLFTANYDGLFSLNEQNLKIEHSNISTNESSLVIQEGSDTVSIQYSYLTGNIGTSALFSIKGSYFLSEANLIVKNEGFALYVGGVGVEADFVNNTIADNTTSGLAFNSNGNNQLQISASIVWNNIAGSLISSEGTELVEYSTIQGGHAGTGVLDSDPVFYDISVNNYKLTNCSPAIDAVAGGTESLLSIDGKTKLDNRDMGTYERWSQVCIDLVASTPADNYLGDLISDFVLVFDQDIQVTSGNLYIKRQSNDELLETIDLSTVTISANELQFTLSSSALYESMYIQIDSAAITSVSNTEIVFDGIRIKTDYNFTFHKYLLYVKEDATGANNGTSWTNAFNDFQDALQYALPYDTIFVAEGTYIPSVLSDIADPLSAVYTIDKGLRVYGGFPQTVVDGEGMEVRDPYAYGTYFSGDVDGDDVMSGDTTLIIAGSNLYRLFTVNSADSIVFDGCNFAGAGDSYTDGTGLDIENGTLYFKHAQFTGFDPLWGIIRAPYGDSLIIDSCTFINNQNSRYANKETLEIACLITTASGTDNSSLYRVTNTVFRNNICGVYINYSNTTSETFIKNCSFINNRALVYLAESAKSTFVNCIFAECGLPFEIKSGGEINVVNNTIVKTNDQNPVFSGVKACLIHIINGSAQFSNSIIWGNTSISSGYGLCDLRNGSTCTFETSILQNDVPLASAGTATLGGGILYDYPMFVDYDNGDYRLQSCSPAIDAGDNAFITGLANYDLSGITDRILDGDNNGSVIVDMGAYEYEYGTYIPYTFLAGYDNYWLGKIDDNWHDAGNWSLNTIPDNTQAVFIPGSDVTCNLPLISAPAACKNIAIHSDKNGKVTIDTDAGGVLEVTD